MPQAPRSSSRQRERASILQCLPLTRVIRQRLELYATDCAAQHRRSFWQCPAGFMGHVYAAAKNCSARFYAQALPFALRVETYPRSITTRLDTFASADFGLVGAERLLS